MNAPLHQEKPVPRFKNPEIDDIYREINSICHPNYPFLSKSYSPSTRMPACDFTPYVTDFLAEGKLDALTELWGYLLGADRASMRLLSIALTAKTPQGLDISDYARNELKATYLLMSRMAFVHHHGAEHPAASVTATTLSTRDFGAEAELIAKLMQIVRLELQDRKKWDASIDIRESVYRITSIIRSGVGAALPFAEQMKVIPPMARVAVSDFISRMYRGDPRGDWWSRRVHFDLGYDERAYGCSADINRSYIEALDILKSADPSDGVPKSITKEVLYSTLRDNGIQVKKTLKRDAMITEAEKHPELLQQMLERCEPDLKVLRAETKETACSWATRNADFYWVAKAVLTLMGQSTL